MMPNSQIHRWPALQRRRADASLLHRIAGAAASAVIAASLALCGAAAADSGEKRGGILEFAVVAEPSNYDCHSNISFAFLHPIAPHYSTLLKFDTANYPQIIGDLAASWSVSTDRLTYTFKLRPDVLFHDGSKLTSADVKASYERLIHPPPGVVSARKVDYAAVSGIETPDPLTVIFRLQWPDAAMLANFASPWNCIYSAAKLAVDAQFPKTHVLGTGPFVFGEYVKGQYWRGRRWDKYFQPGKPYLDGYQADFIPGSAVTAAYKSGRIAAEFRGITPAQRDELVETLGSRIEVNESPWLIDLLVVFNTKHPPFDDARVRRALSLSIDRWGAAEKLQNTSFLKYVGGIMRPGSGMATPESELVTIPGFGRDIAAAHAEARRLLAEAGVKDLRPVFLVRDIHMPYQIGADLLAESWRQIGVTATQEKRGSDWQTAMEEGRFDIALDFTGDFYDDPTIQLTKFVSRDLSPVNFSGATDRFLDALYIGQAVTNDPRQRAKIVRDFERHAMTQAYTVPLLWWNRIVATSAGLKGWNITPSHYIGQDLTDVWLEH
jgi:peptide/nickel transport system substrate-binding protein